MPLTMVLEDSAYQCRQCGNVMQVKKGQLLPPCIRCGGTMERYDGPVPEPKPPKCTEKL